MATLSSHMQIEAKDLEILWKDDPEQWEIVTEGRDDVAHLIGCHYFLVAGSIPECELDQGANYQVSFLVKGTPGSKTDNHVSLMIQAPGKGWLKNEKNIPMNGEWADIATEKVRVNGSSSKLRFYMTNSNNSGEERVVRAQRYHQACPLRGPPMCLPCRRSNQLDQN